MNAQVVTANRLADGQVVYFTSQGGWSETIADGAVAHDKDSATALLLRAERAVAEQVVVEPYLIQVTHKDDGDILPVRYREAIRALGPSVRPDIVTDRSVPD